MQENDGKSHQRQLALAERLETIQAVKEGLASMERGEGRPAEDVFDELEKHFRTRQGNELSDRSPAP